MDYFKALVKTIMSSTDRMSAIMNGLTIECQELEFAEKLDIGFSLHIGSGTYSHVYKARYKSKPVGLKICDNTGVVKRLVIQELTVFEVLKERPHKNIIGFLERFDSFDSKRKWILMEWFDGVDMTDKLMHRGSPFEESLAKYYFKQIVEGLKFLHSLAIVHRDIKLDNILIGFHANDRQKECIKIIDFGFAKIVDLKDGDGTASCKSRIGTEVYMAPEMLDLKDNSDYDAFKSDIFSLAVVLFALLYNSFPDRQITSTTEEYFKVQSKPFEFPDKSYYKVSDSAKQLILGMSREDTVKRFNINQILDSEWMQSSD